MDNLRDVFERIDSKAQMIKKLRMMVFAKGVSKKSDSKEASQNLTSGRILVKIRMFQGCGDRKIHRKGSGERQARRTHGRREIRNRNWREVDSNDSHKAWVRPV